jgi:hypothetical protein
MARAMLMPLDGSERWRRTRMGELGGGYAGILKSLGVQGSMQRTGWTCWVWWASYGLGRYADVCASLARLGFDAAGRMEVLLGIVASPRSVKRVRGWESTIVVINEHWNTYAVLRACQPVFLQKNLSRVYPCLCPIQKETITPPA